MNARPAHEILKVIFDEIIIEAEKNPAFASRMLSALPKGAIAEIRSATTRRSSAPKVEPSSINPVKILRESGDVSLRSMLDKLTKDALSQVVKTNQLTLPKEAQGKNAVKQTIVDGIIRAAQFRLHERAA